MNPVLIDARELATLQANLAALAEVASKRVDDRALLVKEADELRAQLDAWHESFGTTQLTHALAERDALRAERNRLNAVLNHIQGAVEDSEHRGQLGDTLRATLWALLKDWKP